MWSSATHSNFPFFGGTAWTFQLSLNDRWFSSQTRNHPFSNSAITWVIAFNISLPFFLFSIVSSGGWERLMSILLFYNHALYIWVLRSKGPVAYAAFCPCSQHSSAQPPRPAQGFKPSDSLWACWSSCADTLLLHFAAEWQPSSMYNPILLFLYPCPSWLFCNGWLPLPSAQQTIQNSPGLRTFPERTKWKTSPASPLMQEMDNRPKDSFIFILFLINITSYL